MSTCILCGQEAEYFLIYELKTHRVEVALCSPHLDVIHSEMPEQGSNSKVNVRIERITRDSLVPGPRTTRIPQGEVW